MAKVHPNRAMIDSCSSSGKEIFTVWMKSLVFHGNGCTIFNSKGEVVFRVDNYQTRYCSKVFLMDSDGKVLFSLNRKKIRIFGCWEGFKWIDLKAKPWFQVRRIFSILSGEISCKVVMGHNNNRCCYKIVGSEKKSAFKIIDFSGRILAEAVEKQSVGGVPLGNDVLTLMIKSGVDHSLMMALVIVYGLINNKL